MGIKRVVDTDFWTDEKVETFTPEEKYFWIYLLTNPYTKQLGIYHITKKQMSFQLGYDIETVNKLLDRFENDYGMIRYIDSEIAILNFLKYSIIKGGKPVEDCLNADIKNVKHKSLISWVFKGIENDDVSTTVNRIIVSWKESNKERNDNDNDNDNDSIVDVSSTYRGKDDFEIAFKDFEEMRKRIKHPLTQRAKELIIAELNRLATDKQTQIAILNQSIMYSWQGVFPLKNAKQVSDLPTYVPTENTMSKAEEEEILRLMGKQ